MTLEFGQFQALVVKPLMEWVSLALVECVEMLFQERHCVFDSKLHSHDGPSF